MHSQGDRYVFDTFALVALLQAEPGEERVRELLADAEAGRGHIWMSVVNWGELLYLMDRRRGAEAVPEAIAIIDSLPIVVADADRDLARGAAYFKARYPMSYADCFAAALGRQRDAAVVTGDPEFQAVEGYIRIDWLPRRNIGK